MLKLRIADVVIHVILVTVISGYLVNIDNRETDMLRYRRETAGDQEPTTPEPVTDPSTDYQGNPSDTNLHGDTGDGSTHRSEMSGSFDSVTDHNNPLYMSRPGESPPRFMSNVQPDQAETMPEAMALTQEQPTSGSNFQDTPITDTGETGPRPMTQTDNSQDMPRALAQTQDPETSRSPVALPQRQGQFKYSIDFVANLECNTFNLRTTGKFNLLSQLHDLDSPRKSELLSGVGQSSSFS